MSIVHLTADWATYQQASPPAWWGYTNPWNTAAHSPALVNGADYTIDVASETTTFPNGTTISWSFPAVIPNDGSNVWCYPEIIYGCQFGGAFQSPDGFGPTPVQLNALTALTGSINISNLTGNLNNYDILWETQVTSTAFGTKVCEIGFMCHAPSFVSIFVNGLATKYNYNVGGLSATIGITSNGFYKYIIVLPTLGDFLIGTVDFKAIFTFLIAQGELTGAEYIQGYEIGPEPRLSSGSFLVNSISYNWNGTTVPAGATATPTPAYVPTPKAPVTFDSRRTDLAITLSNGNLTATQSSIPESRYAVACTSQGVLVGKYYWEVTVNFDATAQAGIGNTSTSVFAAPTYLGGTANGFSWQANGNTSSNNAFVQTWASFTTATPQLLCFALDMDNKKIWGRVGAAGNWNNAAIGSQNPATNLGGVTIPSAVYAVPVCPAVSFLTSVTTDTATFAFASGSLTGTPPAGFSVFPVTNRYFSKHRR